MSQDEAKYSTSNPVVRWLLERWLTRLARALAHDGGAFLDVGAGEGFALARLVPPTARPVVAVDRDPDKLRSARRRVPSVAPVCADATTMPFRPATFRSVTCTEVLEHVVDPSAVIDELARVGDGRCVVSVPWEPFFRLGNLARAKNVTRLGDDPEHVRHYGRRRLEQELARRFGAITVRGCFPWLVAETRGAPPA